MGSRTLEERLTGADPEPWIPEDEGESIFGEIEEIVERTGDYGPYPLITILTPSGDVWNVAGFGTVLQNKIEELDPQIGDSIGFKFLGEKTTKSGKSTYKAWKVVIARAEVPVGTAADVVAAAKPATGDEFSDAE